MGTEQTDLDGPDVTPERTARVVLLRHAESVSNAEGRFAGWSDVRLTPAGTAEARAAAAAIEASGVTFDICYTSLLYRAIRTLSIVLEDLDLAWIPVVKTWRLNERHFGALQGRPKADAAREEGISRVLEWRQGYQVTPPALDFDDPRHPRLDRRYAGLPPEDIPTAESPAEIVARVGPFWREVLRPKLQSGQDALVVAHGGSLRALITHIGGVWDTDPAEMVIPTGKPFLLELNPELIVKRVLPLTSQEGQPETGR
jgi:2,3-bisphosphoglycerate-dependent phosphoglycerate mutase